MPASLHVSYAPLYYIPALTLSAVRILYRYGEDPYLITRMAVTANRAMQLPLEDSAGRTFLKTSQTTRHYMGYHQSNQMHDPAITVTERDLRDQFLPAYEAMQVNGTAWNGTARNGTGRHGTARVRV